MLEAGPAADFAYDRKNEADNTDPSILNMGHEVFPGTAQFDGIVIPCCDNILRAIGMPTNRCSSGFALELFRLPGKDVACNTIVVDAPDYGLHRPVIANRQNHSLRSSPTLRAVFRAAPGLPAEIEGQRRIDCGEFVGFPEIRVDPLKIVAALRRAAGEGGPRWGIGLTLMHDAGAREREDQRKQPRKEARGSEFASSHAA